MRADTGLQDGVGALWQGDQLLDFTLKVEGQEFRAHKVVLASVSDYFRAMLCGSLKESKSSMVELKEISAEQVSRVLDFIYTGDNSVLEGYPKEMLECGVYFQMPVVIKKCMQTLTSLLDVSNCLELLSTFLKFGVEDTNQKIRRFMKANMKKIISHYKPEELSYDCIQAILKDWKNSEWELFQYLQSWLCIDYDNRKRFMNGFLSQVRFKLMTPEELMAVRDTVEYTDGTGSWRGLVDEAATYHQLPIHHKVLDKSTQNQIRFSKSVIAMETGEIIHQISSRTYVLSKDEDKNDVWKRYRAAKPPRFLGKYPFVIEVNNFLIACHEYGSSDDCYDEYTSRDEFGSSQPWQIFDPRTLNWYGMASLPKRRDNFALVHHTDHLYVLGGCCGAFVDIGEPSKTVLIYSFESNTWTSGKKLPVAVRDHAACVFKDAIYISGGVHQENYEDDYTSFKYNTAKMYCFQLSSQTWERKASMLTGNSKHNMFGMKIKQEESIVVIQKQLTVDYYNPQTDQWSHYDSSTSHLAKNYPVPWDPSVAQLVEESTVLARGNTVYLLKVTGDDHQRHDTVINKYLHMFTVCAKLSIPEDGSEILQTRMGYFPVFDYDMAICGILAFPARSATMDT